MRAVVLLLVVAVVAGCASPPETSDEPIEGRTSVAAEDVVQEPGNKTGGGRFLVALIGDGTVDSLAGSPDGMVYWVMQEHYPGVYTPNEGVIAVQATATWVGADVVPMRVCVTSDQGVRDAIPCVEGSSPLTIDWSTDGPGLSGGAYRLGIWTLTGATVVAQVDYQVAIAWRGAFVDGNATA